MGCFRHTVYSYFYRRVPLYFFLYPTSLPPGWLQKKSSCLSKANDHESVCTQLNDARNRQGKDIAKVRFTLSHGSHVIVM